MRKCIPPRAGYVSPATVALWLACWLIAASVGLAKDHIVSVGASSAADYVLSCRKPNGAFGPRDQEYTDAAWNFPAVMTLRLLGAELSDSESVLRHGLGYPAGHAGYGHWLIYHQALLRRTLEPRSARSSGETPAREPVLLEHQGFAMRYYGSPFGTAGDDVYKIDGASTEQRFREAASLGYYNLSSLHYTLAAVRASGREVANPAPLIAFLHARQAPCGAFVDVRRDDGTPGDAEVHLAHTFHAVASLQLLGEPVRRPEDVISFVRSCQQSVEHDRAAGDGSSSRSGGFRWSPDEARSGNQPDIYYTWCALRTLHLLKSQPSDLSGCMDWVNSLQNHDGGFGDRPGWRSRLYSTFYAVHALALLQQMRGGTPAATSAPAVVDTLLQLPPGGIANRVIRDKRLTRPVEQSISEGEFQIYQGLWKTPVVQANDLAGLRRRGLNLLAMKTADFATAEPLLKTIADDRLSMDVVLCLEAYPHRLRQLGGAVLDHVGNFTLQPRWTAFQKEQWDAANRQGEAKLSWDDYRTQVLAPLQRLGSLCYPEQDFEMEFAYQAYDAGLFGEHGYDAVQAGFNWAPRDFVRVFPWRERYVDKLPPLADADAHGDLAKWSPQLDHVRHLFIARGPGYADFLDAARNGRVVCVIAKPEGVATGVSMYGSPAAVEYVKQRINEWCWWATEK